MSNTIEHPAVKPTYEQLEAENAEYKRRIGCVLRNLMRLSHDRGPDPGPLDGPLWAKVAHVFGMGATRSYELCRKYDLDPDTQTSRD